MNTSPQQEKAKVEIKCIWATPIQRDKWWKFWQKNVTLDDLVKEMKLVGNTVVKIDRKHNRLGLAVGKEE